LHSVDRWPYNPDLMPVKAKGYQETPNGFFAYVKVGKRQTSKRFPKETHPDDIEIWRAKARKELRAAQAEKGTLAYDIQTFLDLMPESRRKTDFAAWLTKWADSDLGARTRASLTYQDFRTLFDGPWANYSGSSKNHLRSYYLSLVKHLDGLKGHAACPLREIPKWGEAKPRKGFFTDAQVAAICQHLPADYADAIEFFATTGWRSEEVKGLLWDEVDEGDEMIRLSPERSKNDEGREFPFDPVREVIERRLALRAERGSPYVFTYVYGGKAKKGRQTAPRVRRIGDWRKTWAKACAAAGCPGALVHAFRRTAVRNLDKLGVPRKVQMSLVGHKTEAINLRYRIVEESELRAAGKRLRARMAPKLPASENGLDTEASE
jgi:integrase